VPPAPPPGFELVQPPSAAPPPPRAQPAPPPPPPPAPAYTPPAPVPARTGVLTDQTQQTTHAIIAWIFTLLTVGYTLPWAIAATRGKSNSVSIALINILLGWTIIGWIVALVMACGPHQVIAAPTMTSHVVIAQQFGQPPTQAYAPAPAVVQQANPPVVATQPATPPPSPPAGWYPDSNGGGQRYWDGRSWTHHIAP
jgi:hypothetical protein